MTLDGTNLAQDNRIFSRSLEISCETETGVMLDWATAGVEPAIKNVFGIYETINSGAN